MLPAEEGAAFIYLMASQRGAVRSAGLESLNSSVIASWAPSAFREEVGGSIPCGGEPHRLCATLWLEAGMVQFVLSLPRFPGLHQ